MLPILRSSIYFLKSQIFIGWFINFKLDSLSYVHIVRNIEEDSYDPWTCSRNYRNVCVVKQICLLTCCVLKFPEATCSSLKLLDTLMGHVGQIESSFLREEEILHFLN